MSDKPPEMVEGAQCCGEREGWEENLQLGAGRDHVLVALADHHRLKIARHKLQAHPLQLLRMILLRQ